MMFSDSEPTLTPTRRTQHDPFSSGDEYLFGPREATESFSAPVVVEAGITPHPKKRSSIVSSLRAPKIDFSGILKKTDFENFVHTLEKETCLFGTVHVKAAAAMITVIDLIFIIFMDHFSYKWASSDVEENSVFIVIFSLLMTIFLAQIGLRYKKSWMLIPLIVIHTSLAIVVSLVMGSHIIVKFIEFKTHPGRLLILFMERWLVTIISFYIVSVLFRAFMHIKRSTTTLPLTVVNALFDKALKDEDVTIYEKTKKFSTPASEKPRTVRFVEPKDE